VYRHWLDLDHTSILPFIEVKGLNIKRKNSGEDKKKEDEFFIPIFNQPF
jgi:hypothetical protein